MRNFASKDNPLMRKGHTHKSDKAYQRSWREMEEIIEQVNRQADIQHYMGVVEGLTDEPVLRMESSVFICQAIESMLRPFVTISDTDDGLVICLDDPARLQSISVEITAGQGFSTWYSFMGYEKSLDKITHSSVYEAASRFESLYFGV